MHEMNKRGVEECKVYHCYSAVCSQPVELVHRTLLDIIVKSRSAV